MDRRAKTEVSSGHKPPRSKSEDAGWLIGGPGSEIGRNPSQDRRSESASEPEPRDESSNAAGGIGSGSAKKESHVAPPFEQRVVFCLVSRICDVWLGEGVPSENPDKEICQAFQILESFEAIDGLRAETKYVTVLARKVHTVWHACLRAEKENLPRLTMMRVRHVDVGLRTLADFASNLPDVKEWKS